MSTIPQARLTITADQVKKELKRLHEGKATGPDNICPRVLRACADQLSGVLQRLFNLSLRLERVPVLWKTSCLVPVPKKGRPSVLNDYRPVALTSHIMKTLERLVLSHLRPLAPLGCGLTEIKQLYEDRCCGRILAITEDSHHPGHELFTPLPSGKRYKSIRTLTTRFFNSFYPQAVRLANTFSHPPWITPTPSPSTSLCFLIYCTSPVIVYMSVLFTFKLSTCLLAHCLMFVFILS
ncbi:RTJK polymerase, partial [Atractosteus spatula]|nr:RTJK polymerase [Atractosteus spatula]